MSKSRWVLVRDVHPELVAYAAKLEKHREEVFQRYWDEMREIYSKGTLVQLFNPRLVEFFENNKVPSEASYKHVMSFLLPEHAWKLEYGHNHLKDELEILYQYIKTCEGCMDMENGKIIVTEADLCLWGIIDSENYHEQ